MTYTYTVIVAINDPALAMTARYDGISAANSLDASQQATLAAGREFGKPGLWSTERVEMSV